MNTEYSESTSSTSLNSRFDLSLEPPLDVHVYHPISNWLVEPFHRAGLTPNHVTTLSKVLGILAIAAYVLGRTGFGALLYIGSYILDCVDGKLARRYKQSSLVGALYDFDTDILQHVLLYLVMIACNGGHLLYILYLVTLVAFSNCHYGLVLAITSVARHRHDDFFTTLGLDVKPALGMTGPLKCMAQFFMVVHKTTFLSYRLLFPKYDANVAARVMAVMKHWGPGSLVTMTALDMFLGIGNALPSLAAIGTVMNGVGSTKLLVASAGAGAAVAYVRGGPSTPAVTLAVLAVQTMLAYAIGAEAGLALTCGTFLVGFLLSKEYARTV